jgi:hypothetical protein
MPTINGYLPGSVIARNVLAGGPASKYPAGNFFPTVADWDAGFVNYAAADYHLLASSPYKNAGTDGADLGANIDRVNTETGGGVATSPAVIQTPNAPRGVRIVPQHD